MKRGGVQTLGYSEEWRKKTGMLPDFSNIKIFLKIIIPVFKTLRV